MQTFDFMGLIDKFTFMIGDYLQGKSIYPQLRRILNVLFSASIASHFYIIIYGQYEWLDIQDYKGFLDFFIKGHFFIPLCLFFICHSIVQAGSIVFFRALTFKKSIKLQRRVLEYHVKKEKIEDRLKDIEDASYQLSPITLKKGLLLNLYEEFENSQSADGLTRDVRKSINKTKKSLETSFILTFRMLIAVTVYFFSISRFGVALYVTTLVTLLIGMYVLIVGYRFMEVIPTVIVKFRAEAERYIKETKKEVKPST